MLSPLAPSLPSSARARKTCLPSSSADKDSRMGSLLLFRFDLAGLPLTLSIPPRLFDRFS